MAFFTQRVKGETDAYNLALRCLEPFHQSCPGVCEALCGAIDEEGKYVVPPMSIAISTENGQLMFRISSSLSDEAFFGSIKDGKQIFDSIELALMTGQYKAIPNKFKKTDIPY